MNYTTLKGIVSKVKERNFEVDNVVIGLVVPVQGLSNEVKEGYEVFVEGTLGYSISHKKMWINSTSIIVTKINKIYLEQKEITEEVDFL